MELTVGQMLQQAVAAHNTGSLQEAEHLYRAILQIQPKHPDANHNLGVLAVSVNKTVASLPLFKAALDANPKIEQFWFSYIDALIKENQFDNAQQVLEQAKKSGVTGEKLNLFENQLTRANQVNEPKSASQKKSLKFSERRKKLADAKKKRKNKNQYRDGIEPSDLEINNLLKLYQNGRFSEAEHRAASITQKFPKYQFGWKVLGAVLAQTGRKFEAVDANQTAVALCPQDAEAHSNLGNTLKEMGRLDEAEASYRQAITLVPGYAEAHSNLGNTLIKGGRLDEAEASYMHAIKLKPDFAIAYNNLGAMLKEAGRLEESVASYRHAIALKPDYAEAHNNLGTTLKEAGKLDEAEASYRNAIALDPDYGEAHTSLLTCLYLLDKKSAFFDELDYLINKDKANAVIGSLTCRSGLKYGLEKPNLFCREPLKYVLHIDLNTPCDFKKIFVEKTTSILNESRISNRQQPLLVNGYQTSGNLFDIQNEFTDQIQKVIRLEIEKYQIKFKNSEEGFIKNWPVEYSLYGWLISMKNGGKLQPHIHDQGWLSGSIYINIPPKLKAVSGNLVVSLGEAKDVRDTRINEEKIIDVTTGSLVLFPASLTHYTIPFESEQERIVLAFDVKRK